mgnify:CR=1 FL=1
MVMRDVDEANTVVLEKAVRNLLSSSRGKKPEEILNNPDALSGAEMLACNYRIVLKVELPIVKKY